FLTGLIASDRLSWVAGMKPCTYCGKENEEVLAACIECGAVFDLPVIQIQPPAISLPPLLPPEPTVLNGGFATLMLGVYLVAQFAGGIVMGLTASIISGLRGNIMDPDSMTTA